MSAVPARGGVDPAALGRALEEIAAGASERDRDLSGAFPEAAVAALERAGVLACTAGAEPRAYAGELSLLRTVAGADAGVARILDGHLNAVERLRVQAPADVRDAELARVAAGELRGGVWGADPAPGEGEPARLVDGALEGTKVFCSGAGGLQRALVLVKGERPGPPLAAWTSLETPGTVAIDRDWFRGAGMHSSASHRVTFRRAPVLAVLGAPGALAAQPWFARDAIRTASTWAGAADAAAEDALGVLARREPVTDLDGLAAARLATARRALGLWLEAAGRELDAEVVADAAGTAATARGAIAALCREIVDEGERAAGSRPLAAGSPLDRAGRDLRLFLLQHRLEPILARYGRTVLEAR